MTSVLDDNVHNVAVEGAFDDCQSMVKVCVLLCTAGVTLEVAERFYSTRVHGIYSSHTFDITFQTLLQMRRTHRLLAFVSVVDAN